MVEQQADAQYIRKQLEDVYNHPNSGKPKEKPGGADKKIPRKLQAYLVLQLKKLTSTRKKAVGRVEEHTRSHTVFFAKQVDIPAPFFVQ